MSEDGCIVAKFGGSSLADANGFRAIKSILESDPRRRYVVVSAPGKRRPDDKKVTGLLQLCWELKRQGMPFADVWARVLTRFNTLISKLDLAGLAAELGFDQILPGVKSADDLISRGEYLAARLMAGYLNWPFVDAIEVIVFDAFGRLQKELTYERMVKVLSRHPRAVLPGFYGRTADGDIKTFPRGGSDITGAIVARAIGATVYENWTDTDGFLTADPAIVPTARPIKVLSYGELRELSYMGARVFHDEAMFPVREAQIPINIRNTFRPSEPGTLIVPDSDLSNVSAGAITGVAGRGGFSVITIAKSMMNNEVGFARKVLAVLESYGVSVEHMPSGIDTMSVVADTELFKVDEPNIFNDIWHVCHPDSVAAHHHLALIDTVGRGMIKTPGIAARLFTVVAEAGVNIRLIDQGSSELNIIIGVEEEDFETAVRAIHHGFIG